MAAVDLEMVLKTAAFVKGIAVVAKSGTSEFDTLTQNFFYGPLQFFNLWLR